MALATDPLDIAAGAAGLAMAGAGAWMLRQGTPAWRRAGLAIVLLGVGFVLRSLLPDAGPAKSMLHVLRCAVLLAAAAALAALGDAVGERGSRMAAHALWAAHAAGTLALLATSGLPWAEAADAAGATVVQGALWAIGLRAALAWPAPGRAAIALAAWAPAAFGAGADAALGDGWLAGRALLGAPFLLAASVMGRGPAALLPAPAAAIGLAGFEAAAGLEAAGQGLAALVRASGLAALVDGLRRIRQPVEP